MAERLTRERVIAHAAQLVDAIGLEQLTITKLGRSLGIAPPGVYRHVADIADLRRGIAQHAVREVTVLLASACAGLSGSAALAALARNLRDWALEHPGRYAALQIAPEPEDVAGRQAAGALLDVIGSALRSYGLAGDDATDAVRLLRSTLHGFIMLEISGGFRQERSTEASLGRIIRALDTSLRDWA